MVLNFSGVDPLTIINSGMTAYLSVKHNDKEVESIQLKLGSANQDVDLVSYFDAVANSRGFVPSTSSEEDRSAELINALGKKNADEVSRNSNRGGRNMYRKSPESTIVGKLAAKYSSTEQSEQAKERYDRLARIVIKERSKFKSFLGIAPKKNHFTKLVRTFSKDKKLK
jgi:hypothetical protein